MAEIVSKYHYEKVWRLTSSKDLLRIIEEEIPDIPADDMLKHIVESCSKGKTVNFTDISFKAKD